MAEIEQNGSGERKKGKQKKFSIRVDFTPMVDMNMLLITFFMLCTSMSKPQTMEISMPRKDLLNEQEQNKVKASKAMTILLGKEGKVYYYMGEPDYENPDMIQETDFSPNGLRAILLGRNQIVMQKIRELKQKKANLEITNDEYMTEAAEVRKGKDSPVVLIKATDFSNYKNLIDVLDEMQICNIGRYAIEALEIQPDFTCVGVIRRKESLGKDAHDLRGVPEYASLADLEAVSGKPDVVLLCAPSRKIPEVAGDLLGRGYNTVDSFDIHDRIVETIGLLEAQAVKGKAVAITAAGWDPGTDSVMRALFEAMAPVGVTFTNFGRGRSMGHSVAARAIAGVADATSITIPLGGGRHSRLVYVVLEEGATFEAVKAAIQADPYFSHDPLDVRQVTKDELPRVADASHGVLMERVGASGLTANQHFTFDMRIDNPALTAQVLVSSARAAVRLAQSGRSGAYTLIDVPPVLLLPGERIDNIGRLV